MTDDGFCGWNVSDFALKVEVALEKAHTEVDQEQHLHLAHWTVGTGYA